MNIIKQPNHIKFGLGVAKDFSFPQNSLVITSKGAISRGWLNYTDLKSEACFDNVEPNPSLETAQKIISIFENQDIECIIGLGGGSSLDVAKFVGHRLNKKKILIPTTFGSGSEVTRIAVLNVDGKKTSFHDDKMFADIALVDPFFIQNSPMEVIKNSAVDACAQCSEGYDSKSGNEYTKFLSLSNENIDLFFFSKQLKFFSLILLILILNNQVHSKLSNSPVDFDKISSIK